MYTKLLTTVSLSWLNWCHQSAPVADHGSTRRKKKIYDRWTCTCNTWKIKSSYRLHIFSWYVIFLRFSYFTFFLFQNNSAGERIFLYTIWFLPFRIRAQIIQCVVPPTLNMRGKPPCTDSAEFNFAENQVVRRLTALQNACGAGNFYFDPQKIP